MDAQYFALINLNLRLQFCVVSPTFRFSLDLTNPRPDTCDSYLQHEASLVAVCRGDDGVCHLQDPVEGRVCPDGHVRPAEVVVNGADHPHDVEVRVSVRHILCDLAA